ncbi:MAG: enoyl-CoA hydratase/isomerase family protein [Burkholderiaceae bacterium]|nr:3-hydroxyacyl-CoA dehydrogenase NAD-binding domain-containing protein [Burkholderiaceae bacterium]MCP5218845.1 enoyl-CoA hydratase/isomerase family protein [Burkholderiaceae bacterium]
MHFNVTFQCLVLSMDHGKVNALSQPLRQYLFDGLAEAARRDEVKWVLLCGKSGYFSVGADLTEVARGTANAAPAVGTVLQAIEASSKPVVALLDGAALGGGFELAMACHARVATTGAKVGLPESKIGLIPGAGGTQRLPRAIGVARAMELMASGKTVAARSFEDTPLVQAVVPSAELSVVLPLAQGLMAKGVQLLRDLPLPVAEAVPSPKRVTDVTRALQSVVGVQFETFDAGLRREYEVFCALRDTYSSKALRHVFAAEQQAVKLEGLEPASADDLREVGVIGAGTMGCGISIALTDSGRTVQLIDQTEEALQRARDLLNNHYAAQVKKGSLNEAQAQERLVRLKMTTRMQALATVDLVIEAVYEDYGAKEAVLREIDAQVRPDTIIATNTSALNANRLAEYVSHSGRFVGLHFFSPANVMRLVEVVRCEVTSNATLARSFALVKALGKLPVLAGVCDGFIGNRMYAKYNAAANDLINMGASPEQVDASLERFGFAMGIFKVGDLAGLELSWAGRKRRALENPGVDYSVFADRLCEAGRFGQKTRAGWYMYEQGSRTAKPDPKVQEMIAQWRKDRGYLTRTFTDQEIVERCVGALAAEGKRLLTDRIAQRMSDVDAVYINGYGFPREQGGPMYYGESIGWDVLDEKLHRIAEQSTLGRHFWLPTEKVMTRR